MVEGGIDRHGIAFDVASDHDRRSLQYNIRARIDLSSFCYHVQVAAGGRGDASLLRRDGSERHVVLSCDREVALGGAFDRLEVVGGVDSADASQRGRERRLGSGRSGDDRAVRRDTVRAAGRDGEVAGRADAARVPDGHAAFRRLDGHVAFRLDERACDGDVLGGGRRKRPARADVAARDGYGRDAGASAIDAGRSDRHVALGSDGGAGDRDAGVAGRGKHERVGRRDLRAVLRFDVAVGRNQQDRLVACLDDRLASVRRHGECSGLDDGIVDRHVAGDVCIDTGFAGDGRSVLHGESAARNGDILPCPKGGAVDRRGCRIISDFDVLLRKDRSAALDQDGRVHRIYDNIGVRSDPGPVYRRSAVAGEREIADGLDGRGFSGNGQLAVQRIDDDLGIGCDIGAALHVDVAGRRIRNDAHVGVGDDRRTVDDDATAVRSDARCRDLQRLRGAKLCAVLDRRSGAGRDREIRPVGLLDVGPCIGGGRDGERAGLDESAVDHDIADCSESDAGFADDAAGDADVAARLNDCGRFGRYHADAVRGVRLDADVAGGDRVDGLALEQLAGRYGDVLVADRLRGGVGRGDRAHRHIADGLDVVLDGDVTFGQQFGIAVILLAIVFASEFDAAQLDANVVESVSEVGDRQFDQSAAGVIDHYFVACRHGQLMHAPQICAIYRDLLAEKRHLRRNARIDGIHFDVPRHR